MKLELHHLTLLITWGFHRQLSDYNFLKCADIICALSNDLYIQLQHQEIIKYTFYCNIQIEFYIKLIFISVI